MDSVKKVLMAAAMLALAGIVGSVIAPKAAHALVATLAEITNTPANPVPTSEALGSATLLEAVCPVHSDSGSSGYFLGPDCYTVPAGKRAVIESIDGLCLTQSGASVLNASLLATTANLSVGHNLPLHLEAGPLAGLNYYSFNFPVRLYADPNTPLFAGIATTDTTGSTQCAWNVAGRLVPTN